MHNTEIKNQEGNGQVVLRLPDNFRKYAILATGTLSMLITLLLFFLPFYTYKIDTVFAQDPTQTFSPIKLLSAEGGDFVNLVVFIGLFVSCAVGFINLIKTVKNYSSSDQKFAVSAQRLVTINTFTVALHFLASVAYCAIQNSALSEIRASYYAASYIPFIIMIVLSVAMAIFSRNLYQETETPQNALNKNSRIELLIYGFLISALTVAASLTDILQVDFIVPANIESVYLNGYDIFYTYNSLGSGFQLVAFVLFTVLTVTISLFAASLVAFISKSKLFYKLTLIEIISGAVFSLVIGLFGKYYEIVQELNKELMHTLFGDLAYVANLQTEYMVKSNSYYYFLIIMVIVAVVLFRKPYTRALQGDASPYGILRKRGPEKVAAAIPQETLPASITADPCPAFTELDFKNEQFRAELEQIKTSSFESPSLPGIVQFVVDYARDSRLHLSYTAEDIAAFIAGLGATRLTILQGMSGTGKTSLPKIFTEAIFGNCEIIEIESSWRDKNELLGYYNEFSRTYTPKKFTQALYKAKLNPEKITFIVLDEMNLSRIEYYFSDFLSLMENEEDKREIKLLNVGLYRSDGEELYPYFGLDDGHTIKIPKNVWFIGTANRDESTFEISDKVYDRAHTMNFNKRAPKVVSYQNPIPQRYLSVEEFIYLLEDAKQRVSFDLTSSNIIREVEELLAPYNISFGNRIANQIEAFVSIYCACFPPSESVRNDALERILLSKVVSKLEFKSIDNKEHLAAQFKKKNLHRCSEFILKLNED